MGLPLITSKLGVNVELASPREFIPLPSEWQARRVSVTRDGPLSFEHFDPYSQALSKLERGHAQDLEDVDACCGSASSSPRDCASSTRRSSPSSTASQRSIRRSSARRLLPRSPRLRDYFCRSETLQEARWFAACHSRAQARHVPVTQRRAPVGRPQALVGRPACGAAAVAQTGLDESLAQSCRCGHRAHGHFTSRATSSFSSARPSFRLRPLASASSSPAPLSSWFALKAQCKQDRAWLPSDDAR